jgi:hypothetical protein
MSRDASAARSGTWAWCSPVLVPLYSALERLQRAEDLVRRRHQAAHSAVEGDRAAALDGQPHVLDHLAGRQLDGQDAVQAAGSSRASSRSGNGQSVIGRNRPTLMPFSRAAGDGAAGDAGGRAVGDDRELGVLELPALPADLVAAISRYLCWRARLRFSSTSGTRSIDLMIRAGRPAAPVRAQSKAWRSGRPEAQFDRLHGLAEDAVGDEHDRRPVALRELEGVAISSMASPIEAGARTGTR